MIVDTSALVAVVFTEPGYERVLDRLTGVETAGIGTPTLAETGVVLSARLGTDAAGLVARLVEEFGFVEVPFGPDHWREAVRAWCRWGRGRHRAGLNLGDCLTYAVASLAAEPLLYTGRDFALTDLPAA